MTRFHTDEYIMHLSQVTPEDPETVLTGRDRVGERRTSPARLVWAVDQAADGWMVGTCSASWGRLSAFRRDIRVQLHLGWRIHRCV